MKHLAGYYYVAVLIDRISLWVSPVCCLVRALNYYAKRPGVPQGHNNRCANFQLERTKVKVIGHQKPPNKMTHISLWPFGPWLCTIMQDMYNTKKSFNINVYVES